MTTNKMTAERFDDLVFDLNRVGILSVEVDQDTFYGIQEILFSPDFAYEPQVASFGERKQGKRIIHTITYRGLQFWAFIKK
jgi:hypothetical protein